MPSPAEQPALSVVIPTWNHRDLVVTCLDSLRAQALDAALEIVVVDDGSQDDTWETVRGSYPEVRYLRRPANGGFAVAANDGIRVARGEWILLLNNDMTLAPGCLANLLQTAERSGADMVAPLVLWHDSPEIVYSAGDAIRRDGRPEPIGFRIPRDAFAPPREIFGVSAGAGLFRRAIFDAAGLLDEAFTAYFEDADLCFRARLAGHTAALCLEAVAYHIGSASIQDRTWWRARQCYRNHALLLIKNLPAPLLLKHAGAILRERRNQRRRCFSAARAAFGARRAAGIVLGVQWDLLRVLPYALGQRWRTRRMRKISPAELDALLTEPRDP